MRRRRHRRRAGLAGRASAASASCAARDSTARARRRRPARGAAGDLDLRHEGRRLRLRHPRGAGRRDEVDLRQPARRSAWAARAARPAPSSPVGSRSNVDSSSTSRGGLPLQPAIRRAASSSCALICLRARRRACSPTWMPHGPLTSMPAGPIASSTPCSMIVGTRLIAALGVRAHQHALLGPLLGDHHHRSVVAGRRRGPRNQTSTIRICAIAWQNHNAVGCGSLGAVERQPSACSSRRVRRRARRCSSSTPAADRGGIARRATPCSRRHLERTRDRAALRCARERRVAQLPVGEPGFRLGVLGAVLGALTLAGVVAAVRALLPKDPVAGRDRAPSCSSLAPPFRDAAGVATPSLLAACGAAWAFACAAAHAREASAAAARRARIVGACCAVVGSAPWLGAVLDDRDRRRGSRAGGAARSRSRSASARSASSMIALWSSAVGGAARRDRLARPRRSRPRDAAPRRSSSARACSASAFGALTGLAARALARRSRSRSSSCGHAIVVGSMPRAAARRCSRSAVAIIPSAIVRAIASARSGARSSLVGGRRAARRRRAADGRGASASTIRGRARAPRDRRRSASCRRAPACSSRRARRPGSAIDYDSAIAGARPDLALVPPLRGDRRRCDRRRCAAREADRGRRRPPRSVASIRRARSARPRLPARRRQRRATVAIAAARPARYASAIGERASGRCSRSRTRALRGRAAAGSTLAARAAGLTVALRRRRSRGARRDGADARAPAAVRLPAPLDDPDDPGLAPRAVRRRPRVGRRAPAAAVRPTRRCRARLHAKWREISPASRNARRSRDRRAGPSRHHRDEDAVRREPLASAASPSRVTSHRCWSAPPSPSSLASERKTAGGPGGGTPAGPALGGAGVKASCLRGWNAS